VRRVLLTALLACFLAGVAPAAAFGEPAWVHDSPVSEQSSGYLPCAGTSGGVLDEVLPSIDYAEAFIDQAGAPPLGGVQLVRIQWFATGGDYCLEQGGTGAAIEIITPPGVELALDAENPALCGFDIVQDASVCPVTTLPGDYGGTLLADPPDRARAPAATHCELRPHRRAALQRAALPARPVWRPDPVRGALRARRGRHAVGAARVDGRPAWRQRRTD
jgi:hypothetical protein